MFDSISYNCKIQKHCLTPHTREDESVSHVDMLLGSKKDPVRNKWRFYEKLTGREYAKRYKLIIRLPVWDQVFFNQNSLTSGSVFASSLGWTTGLTGLTLASFLPCAPLGPPPGLVGPGDVLATGFPGAAGVEEQRLLLISITCDGAMGNSRRLLFLGAVGCIGCIGRLVTFWDVVFYHKKKFELQQDTWEKEHKKAHIIRWKYCKKHFN